MTEIVIVLLVLVMDVTCLQCDEFRIFKTILLEDASLTAEGVVIGVEGYDSLVAMLLASQLVVYLLCSLFDEGVR